MVLRINRYIEETIDLKIDLGSMIVIIGRLKYEKKMKKIANILWRRGYATLMPWSHHIVNKKDPAYPLEKSNIQEAYLRMIDKADLVIMYGDFGTSTSREYEYALEQHKPIYRVSGIKNNELISRYQYQYGSIINISQPTVEDKKENT